MLGLRDNVTWLVFVSRLYHSLSELNRCCHLLMFSNRTQCCSEIKVYTILPCRQIQSSDVSACHVTVTHVSARVKGPLLRSHVDTVYFQRKCFTTFLIVDTPCSDSKHHISNVTSVYKEDCIIRTIYCCYRFVHRR